MPDELPDPILPPDPAPEPPPAPDPAPPLVIPPDPVFPPIPSSDPVIVPPNPGVTWDQWFPGPIVIRSNPDATYDLETIWMLGNANELSGTQTNYVLKNITSPAALVEQLTDTWLEANPDVIAIMPQFLGVLVKIGKQLRGPDGRPIL